MLLREIQISTFLLVWMFANSLHSEVAPKIEDLDCSQFSDRDWYKHRDTLALELSLEDVAYNPRNNCFEEITNAVSRFPDLASCFQPFLDYLKHIDDFDKRRSKVRGSKEEATLERFVGAPNYYELTKQFTKVPNEIAQQGLLELLTLNNDLNIDQYFRQLNEERRNANKDPIDYAIVQSQQLSFGKTSYKRLIVHYKNEVIDGKKFQKWVSYVLPEVSGREVEKNVSVVATSEPDSNGVRNSYYQDHSWNVHEQQIIISAHSATAPNCLNCHISGGPRSVIPQEPVGALFEKGLKAINDSIAELPVTFSPHLQIPGLQAHPDWYKQSRVDIDPTILPASFFRSSLNGEPMSDKDMAKFRKALNCQSCHNGEQRSYIQDNFGSDNSSLTNHIVSSGAMPKGVRLSEPQRQELLKLIGKYYTKPAPNDHTEREKGMLYYFLMSGNCAVTKDKAAPVKKHSGK